MRTCPAWPMRPHSRIKHHCPKRSLNVKRDILTMPLPDPDDDSPEAHRIRALVLDAANSTIEQTIRLRTNQLTPAANDDGIEKVIEERRLAARAAIERMSGKPSNPD